MKFNIPQKRAIRKQMGFTLIEIMIALGIMGAAAAGVLYYQNRAETGQAASKTATDISMIASKVKSYYGPSNSYSALTGAKLNEMSLIPAPMKYDGANVLDPWGNAMIINGGTTSFAITIGGATSPLDKEACNSIASKLAENAQRINVGAATATSGAISGGSVYKASFSSTPDASALATGCNVADAVIAAQFR